MKQIELTDSAADARLAEIVREVQLSGRSVVITRGDKEVATIQPMQDKAQPSKDQAAQPREATRQGAVDLPPITLEQILSARDEGRAPRSHT